MSKKKRSLESLSDNLAKAVEQAGSSTVLVDGRRRRPSSGIMYQEDLVLTADHTVERDEDITVVLPDGSKTAASVAGRDPSHDLALLRLTDAKVRGPEVIKDDVRVGELVLALGRPTTKGIEASLGVVSAVNGPVRTRRGGMIERFIRTDAVPLPGFSGGPLVNVDGLVIGVNTSGLAHGMLLSLPVSVSWKLAKTLAEHGSIKRGYLGIRGQIAEIPDVARDSLGRKQETGLLVVHIELENQPVGSGLLVGDMIVGIMGNPVKDHDELASQLIGDVVGTTVSVDLIRGGTLQSVDVRISELPLRRGRRGARRSRLSSHHHPR
jgi:S1-C subfamily serine protease